MPKVNDDSAIDMHDSEDKFKRLFDAAPSGILVVNRNGLMIMANEQTVALFGYQRTELVGSALAMLLPEELHPNPVLHAAVDVIGPGIRGINTAQDFRGKRKDGTEFFVNIGLSTLPDGYCGSMLAYITDVTARRTSEEAVLATLTRERAERAAVEAEELSRRDALVIENARLYDLAQIDLARRTALLIENARLYEVAQNLNLELEARVSVRTAELEIANQELEAFSYSVSHDLRAPLRAIDGFSKILLRDNLPMLPPEAQRRLQSVRDNAQKMGQLIDDLLTFSRLSRQPLKKVSVVPADLARLVLEELASEQENRQVEITIGDLPICQADPALLKQVFVNLIANALKFTRGCQVARIEIGCHSAAGHHTFFVKDNGVGFSMEYADKLFTVFQRLHRQEDYEGTGVGLAIVHRIIVRHGGRIWPEAASGQGATFYFTLPGETLDANQ